MNSGVKLKGNTQVTGSDTGLIQALATIGSITAYIYAGSMNFAYYKSGIYSDTACTGQIINHVVMLVGYAANATGIPYYILRNSWVTTCGMNGYMYISRGYNMCSVASYNYYPKNVTLNSNLTTVATLITTTLSSKTNAPLNISSTATTASTTSTAKTTIL
jgi:C1A family cysteine protease